MKIGITDSVQSNKYQGTLLPMKGTKKFQEHNPRKAEVIKGHRENQKAKIGTFDETAAFTEIKILTEGIK
jgi:hypothetical protein